MIHARGTRACSSPQFPVKMMVCGAQIICGPTDLGGRGSDRRLIDNYIAFQKSCYRLGTKTEYINICDNFIAYVQRNVLGESPELRNHGGKLDFARDKGQFISMISQL